MVLFHKKRVFKIRAHMVLELDLYRMIAFLMLAQFNFQIKSFVDNFSI